MFYPNHFSPPPQSTYCTLTQYHFLQQLSHWRAFPDNKKSPSLGCNINSSLAIVLAITELAICVPLDLFPDHKKRNSEILKLRLYLHTILSTVELIRVLYQDKSIIEKPTLRLLFFSKSSYRYYLISLVHSSKLLKLDIWTYIHIFSLWRKKKWKMKLLMMT